MKTDRSGSLSLAIRGIPSSIRPPIRHSSFVIRHSSFVIRTKINYSGSLSLVIRGIPPSIRPPISHSGESRNPEGRGEGNAARSKTSRGEGLVPRWGRGGAWQNPPCQFAVPNHNSGFSYLGVPAEAGMSDWYENAPKLLSSAPANPSIRHSREGGNPRTNIPRKNVNRDTTTYVHTVTPFRHSRPLISSLRRQPESCSAGACPPLGSGCRVAEPTVPIRCTNPQLPLFIPWCAGTSRHERLLRKHVPDPDPG